MRIKLYEQLPSTLKTILVRQSRHAGHCWRSKGELISDVLRWTTPHGRARVGWPARPYQQRLCPDTGCNMEDLSKAMDGRDEWWERVRKIRARSTPRWWSCRVIENWLLYYREVLFYIYIHTHTRIYIYIYIYIYKLARSNINTPK